jgi:hypothetical protein
MLSADSLSGSEVPYSPDVIGRYDHEFDNSMDFYIQAYEKDTTAGMSGSRLGDLLLVHEGNDYWYVSSIHVDIAHRGQGIATGMYSAFVIWRPTAKIIHAGKGMSSDAQALFPSLKSKWPNNHFFDRAEAS